MSFQASLSKSMIHIYSFRREGTKGDSLTQPGGRAVKACYLTEPSKPGDSEVHKNPSLLPARQKDYESTTLWHFIAAASPRVACS